MAGVPQLVITSSLDQKIAGLISTQGTCLGCEFGPWPRCIGFLVWMHVGDNQLMFFSFVCFSFPLPLSLLKQ